MAKIKTIQSKDISKTLGSDVANALMSQAKKDAKQEVSRAKRVDEYDGHYEVFLSLGPGGPEKSIEISKEAVAASM